MKITKMLGAALLMGSLMITACNKDASKESSKEQSKSQASTQQPASTGSQQQSTSGQQQSTGGQQQSTGGQATTSQGGGASEGPAGVRHPLRRADHCDELPAAQQHVVRGHLRAQQLSR